MMWPTDFLPTSAHQSIYAGDFNSHHDPWNMHAKINMLRSANGVMLITYTYFLVSRTWKPLDRQLGREVIIRTFPLYLGMEGTIHLDRRLVEPHFATKPTYCLPLLSNIYPPAIRRIQALLIEHRKIQDNPDWLVQEDIPTPRWIRRRSKNSPSW